MVSLKRLLTKPRRYEYSWKLKTIIKVKKDMIEQEIDKQISKSVSHIVYVKDYLYSNFQPPSNSSLKTRLAVDKVKTCTGDGVGVVMQNKPSCY